jgi:hypothetical protein
MSDEPQKLCNDCNHEKNIHGVIREPYGRLCTGCLDGGNNDPCRNFSQPNFNILHSVFFNNHMSIMSTFHKNICTTNDN